MQSPPPATTPRNTTLVDGLREHYSEDEVQYSANCANRPRQSRVSSGFDHRVEVDGSPSSEDERSRANGSERLLMRSVETSDLQPPD
jgi:hypothetical protein